MNYPEHGKLGAVRAKSQTVGSFLDWLLGEKAVELMQRYSREEDSAGDPVYRNSEGRVIEDWPPPHSGHYEQNHAMREKREQEEGIEQRLVLDPRGDKLIPSVLHTEELLAEFFEVDLVKLEKERRKMLDECRKNNESPSTPSGRSGSSAPSKGASEKGAKK